MGVCTEGDSNISYSVYTSGTAFLSLHSGGGTGGARGATDPLKIKEGGAVTP